MRMRESCLRKLPVMLQSLVSRTPHNKDVLNVKAHSLPHGIPSMLDRVTTLNC